MNKLSAKFNLRWKAEGFREDFSMFNSLSTNSVEKVSWTLFLYDTPLEVMPSHLQIIFAVKELRPWYELLSRGIKYILMSTCSMQFACLLSSSISSSRIIKHDGEKCSELRPPSIWKCVSCFRRLYLIVSFAEHNCRSCWKADWLSNHHVEDDFHLPWKP